MQTLSHSNMFIFDKKIHPYNVAISLPPVNHFSYILADTAGNLQQKSIMVSPPVRKIGGHKVI